MEFLSSYLEVRFKLGMSWSNHGRNGWHVDHIIPCAMFDLTIVDNQKICFHYTNLQPLWWWENIAKSDSIEIENVRVSSRARGVT